MAGFLQGVVRLFCFCVFAGAAKSLGSLAGPGGLSLKLYKYGGHGWHLKREMWVAKGRGRASPLLC